MAIITQTVGMAYPEGETAHQITAANPMPVVDPMHEILRGQVTGSKIIRAFGERVNITTAAAGDDVWRGPTGQVPIPNQSGQQMEIVSTSPQDAAGGIGIQSIDIHYLNVDGDERKQTVVPTGTTPALTVATDIRFVQRMHATVVGSNGVGVGDVSLQDVGGGGVYCFIFQGGNMSLLTNRMVPNGKKLYVRGWHAEEARGGRVVFRLRSTSDDDGDATTIPAFLFKDSAYLESSNTGPLPAYFVVPALSVIKISAWAEAVNSEGSAGWWGILVDD